MASADIPIFFDTEERTLVDNHGRAITYLRLAITDRCNLRCRYCMPEQGVRFVPCREILRYEEMLRLIRIFTRLGVTKVRITGGEPFARRDCLAFLRQVREIPGVEHLNVTTNGIATAQYLEALQKLGISGINLSLDTLDRRRFWQLTRYDFLDMALNTFHGALHRGIPLKINTVVIEDTTDSDILSIAELARQYPVTVRYIEKMPFTGGSGFKKNHAGQLRSRLEALLPEMRIVDYRKPSTALVYEVPGFVGRIGIIEGHSRKFCATCNKVRITPLGILKTCLYDNGVLDLKALLRSGDSDAAVCRSVTACIANRFADGLEAEAQAVHDREPSMASIGG